MLVCAGGPGPLGSSRVLSGPLGSSRGSARQGIEDEEANARMSGARDNTGQGPAVGRVLGRAGMRRRARGARDNTGRHQGWWVG